MVGSPENHTKGRKTMEYGNVLEFVTANPVFNIATSDQGCPRVRAFLTVLFDDGLIHFTTSTKKAVGRQLAADPRVELCYCAPDFSKMLRIEAEVEELDDRSKKARLVAERDYLQGVDPDDPTFKLMRITHGTARFWTLADNMREAEIPAIKF
ncbi:pyridoxamine 5'-phosphate oxidase [Geobacter sp. OR-1]|uniref:pyridoxamine 5'-phosphate oxidase family protein n=1 Tax=Geobacter sp. OR-1 TaxID=1266765 RepID=UPI000544026F|nr:pyridoxamine 5'-phosphate oxidase family protein [Geobacter sp. OR-1]GAM08492.1 pyridoxamine 5'-phosphate oxidase [Geobacter sp. OR-1]